ncbi:RNA-binding S4 domain-containing protein [Erythrobacter sp. R86502]|uniref:RNA-binding S4 domain-containing protein n=1 Tax=Erythrobacter sp. R86502 TaxID=3093846 RepID=UPI0036D39990
MASGTGQSIRADRLLVYLRLARTRSAAITLIETHALRRNRKHVLRGAEQVRIGDVLTLAVGRSVRVIELVTIPDRRGTPSQARLHYRDVDAEGLDPKAQNAIAASPLTAGLVPDDSEDRF